MPATDLHDAAPAGATPNHHIPAELLLDYAAGSLAESWSLVVACHLTLCPQCRRELAAIEQLGGSLLEQGEARPMRPGAFEAIAAQLGSQEPADDYVRPAGDGRIPAPLHGYLGRDIDHIPWRWSGAGLKACALSVPKARGGMATLLQVAPGAGLPLHTHRGDEMTLVLSGGYTDERGAFRRGDIEFADGGIEHRPVAMLGEPCICLAVTDAPLRFRGRLGWILDHWARLSS